MKTTVIFTTYNQPDWLEKTLWGFKYQDTHDFDVIVADDGSSDSTRARLEALRETLPFKLDYVWQPDEGFRKCRILNAAIAKAQGDYLIFTDGDCVARADFVRRHLELSELGRFLSGGYYKLPLDLSQRIGEDDVASQRVFSSQWLSEQGHAPGWHSLKWRLPAAVGSLFNQWLPTKKSFNGHNSSCFRSDAIKVNGFNEEMQYGGPDLEFGLRLEHAGILSKQIRYSTITLHLEHDRGYATTEMRAASAAVKARTRAERLAWCENGLQQHLSA